MRHGEDGRFLCAAGYGRRIVIDAAVRLGVLHLKQVGFRNPEPVRQRDGDGHGTAGRNVDRRIVDKHAVLPRFGFPCYECGRVTTVETVRNRLGSCDQFALRGDFQLQSASRSLCARFVGFRVNVEVRLCDDHDGVRFSVDCSDVGVGQASYGLFRRLHCRLAAAAEVPFGQPVFGFQLRDRAEPVGGRAVQGAYDVVTIGKAARGLCRRFTCRSGLCRNGGLRLFAGNHLHVVTGLVAELRVMRFRVDIAGRIACEVAAGDAERASRTASGNQPAAEVPAADLPGGGRLRRAVRLFRRFVELHGGGGVLVGEPYARGRERSAADARRGAAPAGGHGVAAAAGKVAAGDADPRGAVRGDAAACPAAAAHLPVGAAVDIQRRRPAPRRSGPRGEAAASVQGEDVRAVDVHRAARGFDVRPARAEVRHGDALSARLSADVERSGLHQERAVNGVDPAVQAGHGFAVRVHRERARLAARIAGEGEPVAVPGGDGPAAQVERQPGADENGLREAHVFQQPYRVAVCGGGNGAFQRRVRVAAHRRFGVGIAGRPGLRRAGSRRYGGAQQAGQEFLGSHGEPPSFLPVYQENISIK